jgi:hypothetical protein
MSCAMDRDSDLTVTVQTCWSSRMSGSHSSLCDEECWYQILPPHLDGGLGQGFASPLDCHIADLKYAHHTLVGLLARLVVLVY